MPSAPRVPGCMRLFAHSRRFRAHRKGGALVGLVTIDDFVGKMLAMAEAGHIEGVREYGLRSESNLDRLGLNPEKVQGVVNSGP